MDDDRTWFALQARAELIREAGALARLLRPARDARRSAARGPQDIVSEADVAVEHLIKGRLAEASPTTPSSARRPAMPTSPAPAASGSSTRSTARSPSSAGWTPGASRSPSWMTVSWLRADTAPRADELFTGGRGARRRSTAGRSAACRPGADRGHHHRRLFAADPRRRILPVFDRLLEPAACTTATARSPQPLRGRGRTPPRLRRATHQRLGLSRGNRDRPGRRRLDERLACCARRHAERQSDRGGPATDVRRTGPRPRLEPPHARMPCRTGQFETMQS